MHVHVPSTLIVLSSAALPGEARLGAKDDTAREIPLLTCPSPVSKRAEVGLAARAEGDVRKASFEGVALLPSHHEKLGRRGAVAGNATPFGDKATLCRVLCVRGGDSQGGVVVDGPHFLRLGEPVSFIVLDDAKRVDPEVSDVQLSSDVDRVSECLGKGR
jgi:hypothetical protein